MQGDPACVPCGPFQISPNGLKCVQDVAKVRVTAMSVAIPVGVVLLICIIVGAICCARARKRAKSRTVTSDQAPNVSMATPITFTYDEIFEKAGDAGKIVY